MRQRMLRNIFALLPVAIVVLGGLFTGCGKSAEEAESTKPVGTSGAGNSKEDNLRAAPPGGAGAQGTTR